MFQENGFLRGRTYSDKDILIYCLNDLHLLPTKKINIWLYILGRDVMPLDTYDAIEFVGVFL